MKPYWNFILVFGRIWQSEAIGKFEHHWQHLIIPWQNVTDTVAYWAEISLYKDAIGENTYKKLAGFAQRILCSLYHTVMQKWKMYSAR